MKNEAVPVTVHILDKDYRIACPEEERDSLIRSAHYLDEKMKEVRITGKIVGADRITVMAALNIVHELIEEKTRSHVLSEIVNKRLLSVQQKVDAALEESKQMAL